MNFATIGKSTKQREGVWLQFSGPDGDLPATEFLIAASRNKAFLDRAAQLRRPFKQRDGSLKVPDNKVMPLFWQAMFGTVVLGWRGMTDLDDAGKRFEVPFTEADWLRFTQIDDQEVRTCLDWIVTEADNEANFQSEVLAADTAAIKSV